MQPISKEFIGAVALLVYTVLHGFGIEVANNVIDTAITGLIAVWTIGVGIYERRHTIFGRKLN